MSAQYKVGDIVYAVKTITEAGPPHEGDPKAVFPQRNYIHATYGDEGVVEYINSDGYPTVRFKRKGTATIVDHTEISFSVKN